MAYVKIRPRRGTKAQWEYANPILSEGEMAFEVPETGVGTGNINIKQGDGTTSWNNLPYAFNAGVLNDKVDALSEQVSTYDATINQMSIDVEAMKEEVTHIRKMDIQANEPDYDLLLGQVWLNSDMVTGSMALLPRTATIEAGGSTRLTLTTTLSAYDEIKWKLSTEGIVTLSNTSDSGVTVTGILNGDVTVTALAILDGATIYTASSAISVSVTGAMSIDPATERTIIGNTNNLVLTNSLSNYDSIQWVSSAPYYASIELSSDEGCTIRSLLSGSATIYARAILNGTSIASATSVITVVGMKMNKNSTAIAIGESDTISLENTMIEGTDYDTITWESSGPNVAYISASSNTSATITGVTAGNCTISAKAFRDGTMIQQVQCSVVVTGSIRLDKNTLGLIVDQIDALNCTNTLAPGTFDTIVWSTSDDSVVSISSTDSSCIVTALAAGFAIVTVTAYFNSQLVSSDSCTVAVQGGIIMTEPEKTMVAGSTSTLSITDTLPPESYDHLKWYTDDASLVKFVGSTTDKKTVNIEALSTAVPEGEESVQCTITCRAINDPDPDDEEPEEEIVDETECVITIVKN